MEPPFDQAGTLILVVGPSGAGKDTLIAYCQKRLAGNKRIVFPRRSITRPPGDDAENHVALDTAEFARRAGNGEFALHWRAHGLHYGVPVSIDADIAAGRSIVVNVSRSIIGEARKRYKPLVVISVTAAREELARRLHGRGREEDRDIEERLARAEGPAIAGPDVVHMDNSGSLEDAGNALWRILDGVVNRARGDTP
jgi:ribose 1,5-bisphosphokinase